MSPSAIELGVAASPLIVALVKIPDDARRNSITIIERRLATFDFLAQVKRATQTMNEASGGQKSSRKPISIQRALLVRLGGV